MLTNIVSTSTGAVVTITKTRYEPSDSDEVLDDGVLIQVTYQDPDDHRRYGLKLTASELEELTKALGNFQQEL